VCCCFPSFVVCAAVFLALLCVLLCFLVLCGIVLLCFVLCSVAFSGFVLCAVVLFCVLLRHFVWCCVSSFCFVFHFVVLFCVLLCCVQLSASLTTKLINYFSGGQICKKINQHLITSWSNVHVGNSVTGHMAEKRPAFLGTEKLISTDLDVILIHCSPPIQVLFHKIDFNNILSYTLRSLRRFLPFLCFH